MKEIADGVGHDITQFILCSLVIAFVTSYMSVFESIFIA